MNAKLTLTGRWGIGGAALVAMSFMLMLSGCLFSKSDPTRFFVLEGSKAEFSSGARSDLKVGVALVSVPDYLKKRSIATRYDGEVRYSTFEEWAEDLDHAITRVLGQNLKATVGTSAIWLETWSTRAVTAEIHVSVEDFAVDNKGKAKLVASWKIAKPGGVEILRTGSSHFEKALAGKTKTMVEQTRLLQQLLAELSQELASALMASSGK